jgi:glutamine cyclotransferase
VTTAPVEIPKLSEVGTSYEGLDTERGFIWVTLHDEGLGVFTYDVVGNAFTRVSTFQGTLANAWDILVEGNLAYLADGVGGLVTLDVSDPMNIVELDRVVFGGQARDIMKNGDVLYVAAESGGVAVIDVADPTNLAYIQSMDVGNGGAIALDYDNGKLYVAAWNDARVYDTTIDPYYPSIIGAVRHTVAKEYNVEGDEERPDITDRVLAVAGKDDFLFDGTWWVPTNWAINPGTLAPFIDLPQAIAQMTFPSDLLAGEQSTYDVLIENEGTADLTVYDIWSTNPAFVPSTTGVVIPPGGEATVTLTFTATIGTDGVDTSDTAAPQSAEETGILNIVSDDPSQPIRQGYMEGNIDSLGVGDPFPETLVTLNDGSDWAFTTDALGSVTMIAYFATF